MQPVSQENLLIAAIAGAVVVLAGAGYALLFAFSKLLDRPSLMTPAYGFYACLALSVMVLSETLSLHGYWWILVFLMLIGYLLAPHGIWHLCVATHRNAGSDSGGVEYE